MRHDAMTQVITSHYNLVALATCALTDRWVNGIWVAAVGLAIIQLASPGS
jgi:hypothetical protein